MKAADRAADPAASRRATGVTTMVLIAAALILAAWASPAMSSSLADRLPAGASVVGEADLAGIRNSGVVDPLEWSRAAGPAVLEQAGVRMRTDVDRFAVSVHPSAGQSAGPDVVALLSGRFDAPAIGKALVAQGAKAARVGDVAAWRIPGGQRLQVHPALPTIDMGTEPLLVSFLGDLLVMGTEKGTRAVHGPRQGIPSPALAAARGAVPTSALAWIAVDIPSAGASAPSGLSHAQGLRSVTAWGLAGETLELRALAKATDAARATQLAGMASMLAGIASASPEGQILRGIDIKASGDAVHAMLKLTPDQLRVD